jgi:pyruvate/2-oxoglutarate dehydrogenase complex dihydrolipoamide dehydrogenase (E3) component
MSGFDYDLIVIGGGGAGMVSSRLGAGLGRRVALIEHGMLGGECTRFGCVPSKALIKAANMYHYAVEAGRMDYGLTAEGPAGIYPAYVMEHVRDVIGKVYEGERPEVFQKAGIDVIIGEPAFRDNHHVEVEGRVLSAQSFIVCTGSSAFIPPIEGIDTVPYLTNETIFDMARLPRSMMVLGGGPIGTELAQAFQRLGVGITIVEMGEQILMREDRELRDQLARRLADEGLAIMTKTKAVRLSGNTGSIRLVVEEDGRERDVEAESILVAVGRKANVEGLGLKNAGVEYSPKGIRVDDTLKTTAPNIYACGDVAGPYQFSHMAEYQARIATQNALLPIRKHAGYEHYIWCMFTDPELAHAGLTEEEARESHGDKVRVYRWKYEETDRGRTDGEELGMSKVICDEKFMILGAHILGSRAGDLIHELQVAKTLGIPFYKLDSVIHIYPTFSDVIKQPAKLAYIDELKGNLFVQLLGTFLGPRK